MLTMQVEFVISFLGVTVARAVAAPLNQNYTKVRLQIPSSHTQTGAGSVKLKVLVKIFWLHKFFPLFL